MGPVLPNSIDAARWLLARASEPSGAVQPRKLHCLLFLAQAHFAAERDGERFLPSIFVVDRIGPFEPNLFVLFEAALIAKGDSPLPDAPAAHLERIWTIYGGRSADRLNAEIAEMGQGVAAFEARGGAEITLDDMRRMIPVRRAVPRISTRKYEPKGQRAPRKLRNAAGRDVTVTAWTPRPHQPGRG